MEHEQAQPTEQVAAGLVARNAIEEGLVTHGRFRMECHDTDGNLKWFEEWDNVITTQGKNDWLDKYFEGSAYTAAWYVGLIDASGFSAVDAGDTASSHAGWTEATQYDESTRPALSFAAASSASKATDSASTFTISATKTIKGAFVISESTKGGTTGVLFSAKAFSADRNVLDGDTLNVSYTASLS